MRELNFTEDDIQQLMEYINEKHYEEDINPTNPTDITNTSVHLSWDDIPTLILIP